MPPRWQARQSRRSVKWQALPPLQLVSLVAVLRVLFLCHTKQVENSETKGQINFQPHPWSTSVKGKVNLLKERVLNMKINITDFYGWQRFTVLRFFYVELTIVHLYISYQTHYYQIIAALFLLNCGKVQSRDLFLWNERCSVADKITTCAEAIGSNPVLDLYQIKFLREFTQSLQWIFPFSHHNNTDKCLRVSVTSAVDMRSLSVFVLLYISRIQRAKNREFS
jgi:hypothetical protein